MKYVLFVLDGVADRPLAELGGKTPLEAAASAPLNLLGGKSLLGRAKTIPDGVLPGTDPAFLTIFGAKAKGASRAAIEAAGMNIFLPAGWHAMRANIVGVDKGVMLSHCGGGLTDEEGKALAGAVADNAQLMERMGQLGLNLTVGEGFRHIWSTTGEAPCGVPPHDHIGQEYGQYLIPRWADIMECIHQFMDALPFNTHRRAQGKIPANMLWPWAGGEDIVMPDFKEKYGISGCCATGVPLVKGVARLAGLEAPDIEGATGEPDTDWRKKTQAGIDMLKTHDFLLLHLEAPDEQAHRGNIPGKVEAVRTGGQMLDMLVSALEEDCRILVMSDHYTMSDTRLHDATPVPYMLYDSRHPRCGAPFTENACANTELIGGAALLEELING